MAKVVISVSLDGDVISEVERLAKKTGMNRSMVVNESLRRSLKVHATKTGTD